VLVVAAMFFVWALLPDSKLAENLFGRKLISTDQTLGLLVPYFLGWIFGILAAGRFVYEVIKAEKQGKTKRPKTWINTSK